MTPVNRAIDKNHIISSFINSILNFERASLLEYKRSHMSRSIAVIITLLFSISFLNAQNEIGIQVGGLNMLGDFGGGPGNGGLTPADIDWQQTQPMVGIFHRLTLSDHWTLKSSAQYGKLVSTDDASENQDRYDRGLSSTSPLVDVAVKMEFNFWPVQPCSRYVGFTPYVGLGIGGMYYNPTVTHRSGSAIEPGVLEDYNDAHTYVIDNPKKFYYNVPVAFGLKFNPRSRWNYGLEMSYRYTRTDDLDNYVYSDTDSYLMGMATASFTFCGKGPKNLRCPGFNMP